MARGPARDYDFACHGKLERGNRRLERLLVSLPAAGGQAGAGLGRGWASSWACGGTARRRRAFFELVADESLVRVLGSDARHFLDLKRAGAIRTASVADGEILRLARDLGLHVITRDHYTDHRASHRWIEQSPERFHAWDTVDDVVTLAPLGIKTRSAQDVSQAREVKVLRHSAKLDARNPAHRKSCRPAGAARTPPAARPRSGRASCSPGPGSPPRAPPCARRAPGRWSPRAARGDARGRGRRPGVAGGDACGSRSSSTAR